MSQVVTEPIDIQKYKCVPLDLLRNVSSEEQVQFNANTQGVSLHDFTTDVSGTLLSAGPLRVAAGGKPIPADTIETVLIVVLSIFAGIFFLVILFYGGLRLHTHGFAGFSLPDSLKGLPVIAAVGIVAAGIGIVIGLFIPR